MIEELQTASNLLDVALERYITACSAIENCSIPQDLLGRLSNELSLVTSYATKIGHAKLVLSRTQNRSALVPINMLPTEILTRVFDLALRMQECGAEVVARIERNQNSNYNYNHLTKPLDRLSYVCSRWRRIMTTCPNFWTHIDLVPNCRSSKRLLTLAKEYLTRAGQFPLDFHIIDANLPSPDNLSYDHSLFQFLASAGPRMRTLHLVTLGEINLFHSWVLKSCFEGAIPGTLTRLYVSGQPQSDDISGTFLEPAELSRGPGSLLLRLSKQVLEDLWHPVRVLRLTGLYPYWDSRAYHGLVELRLTQWGDEKPIMTKSQLAEVLTSSPKLRVLQLDFGITELFGINVLIDPVQLEDLEVLNVLSMSDSELNAFLPLIVPGSKPLQLALSLPDQALYPLSEREIYRFLDRSNVTRLYITGPDANLWLGELLDESPQLRALSVHCYTYTEISMPSPYPSDDEFSDLDLHLDELYIQESHVDLEDIRRLVEIYPVHTLTVRRCHVSRNRVTISDAQELKDSLVQLCPVVKLLTENEEDPTDDWELFHWLDESVYC